MTTTHRYPHCPLSDVIARFTSGVSVNAEDRVPREDEHGVLKVSAVGIGRFDPSESKAVYERELARLGPSVRRGDLLVTRANTHDLVGAATFVDRDYPKLHLSDKTWSAVLRDDDWDSRRWLAHLLNMPTIREQLRRRATGTSGSMKNIGQGSYLSIVAPCAPRSARGPIADIADALTVAAAQSRALILAKRRFKMGLMQRLLSGALLPGSRQMREVSGEWRTFRLGELFAERTETGRDDLPLLSITADRGIVNRDEIERRDTSNVDKGRYLRIVPGDIGYNTMRMWQGVSALSSLEGIVSPAYTVLIPGPLIDGAYAAQVFKYPPVINEFRRHSQGLVDDTLNLKFHQFGRIRLAFPPIEAQRSIAALLTLLDRELLLIDRLASALDRQKGALLDKILSGEIRVAAT